MYRGHCLGSAEWTGTAESGERPVGIESEGREGGPSTWASVGAGVRFVPGLVVHLSCVDPGLLVSLSTEGTQVLALSSEMMGWSIWPLKCLLD